MNTRQRLGLCFLLTGTQGLILVEKAGAPEPLILTKMNVLASEEANLNLEASKLCFAFKKNHKLPPSTNYTLDEWNGQLVKQ